MDESQQNKTTDTGATRKRRSSILKLQRAPRAPFSEVEFNVATPSDTTKSRRVSFSHRTGVAEFATNEATTTWKNFYEEHNKALESSGNESEVKPPRPSVGHISKAFQYFQDTDPIDLIAVAEDGRRASEASIDVNLLNLESTIDGRRLTAPQQNIELSMLTANHSKVFGEELAISGMGELSDRISVNFSNIQPIGNGTDDLDEIQKKLRDPQPNNGIEGPSPAFDAPDVSEYIEFDLNTTSAAIRNDESDMSITDTISSPKVQDVTKPNVSVDKKASLNKDWVADKENIMVNPYVTPKESINFAINEEPDKVLVFDGKRLTVQCESRRSSEANFRQTLLPNTVPDATPQRKTIVLNVDDDLPNVSTVSHMSLKGIGVNRTIANETNISMTQALSGHLEAMEETRGVAHDSLNDVSFTQGVPSNVILPSKDPSKTKTVIYDTDSVEISMTQAVETNLILGQNTERRKTIVYEDGEGEISITQAVPKNMLLSQPTVVFESDSYNISVTQAVSENLMLLPNCPSEERRKTVIYDADDGDVSITQVVPKNLVLSGNIGVESDGTILCQVEENLSLTQAVPSREILTRSVHNAADISMTKVLPTNIISSRQPSTTDRRKTELFEADAGDISMTQSIPKNIILVNEPTAVVSNDDVDITTHNEEMSVDDRPLQQNKRRTIVYENQAADMSVTQAVSTDILVKAVESTEANTVSESDMIPEEIVDSNGNVELSPQKVTVSDRELSEVQTTRPHVHLIIESSSSQTSQSSSECPPDAIETDMHYLKPNVEVDAIQSEVYFDHTEENIHLMSETNVTAGFDNLGNTSASKPIPSNIVSLQKNLLDLSKLESLKKGVPMNDQLSTGQLDVLVYQTERSVTHTVAEVAEKGADVEEQVSKLSNSLPAAENLDSSCEVREERSTASKLEQEDVPQAAKSASVSTLDKSESKVKKSILDDLLDMSDFGTEDKSVTARFKSDTSTASNESLFYIQKDDDDDVHTQTSKTELSSHSIRLPPLAIEFKPETSMNQNKYELVKFDGEQSIVPAGRSSGVVRAIEDHENTKDLLELLSHFTDKEEKEDPLDGADETSVEGEPVVIDKPAIPVRQRLSFIPGRQSILINRDDLLSNISRANEILQNTRNSPSIIEDDTGLSMTDMSVDRSSNIRKVRLSNEVVKTLQFEDDDTSFTDLSQLAALRSSIVKKTAFGEKSYMDENLHDKARVIPPSLKDAVSDNLKRLMSDLVKPMGDNMPFETAAIDKSRQGDKLHGFAQTPVRQRTSTCSMQVQANLYTSSQIDLVPDAPTPQQDDESEPPPSEKESKESLSSHSEASTTLEVTQHQNIHQHVAISRSLPVRVLTFDPGNPLNNVYLPIAYSEVHRYNPIKPSQAKATEPSQAKTEPSEAKPSQDQEEEDVNKAEKDQSPRSEPQPKVKFETMQTVQDLHVRTVTAAAPISARSTAVAAHASVVSVATLDSNFKRVSTDQSVDTPQIDNKSTETNTLIAMKSNKELLDTSSSLTLVDDAMRLRYVEFDEEDSKSKLHVIFKNEDKSMDEFSKTDVDDVGLTSDNETDKPDSSAHRSSRSKKRRYAARKARKSPVSDTPPKPCLKMQKRSHSPGSEKTDTMTSPPPCIRSPRQQMITQYRVATAVDSEEACTALLREMKRRADPAETMESSSASQSQWSESSTSRTVSGAALPMDWQPELIDELSSKNLVLESDDAVNVLGKLDAMPFMGTRDFEWESSSAELWSFRILHRRIRLSVRLAPRAGNAAGYVRADTPVLAVSVDAMHSNKKNAIATLTVRFALSSVRHYASQGVGLAGAVPALARRAANVARVALRWGRAMHDARLHLAFDLNEQGALSLKVANIPMRSVWEVSIQIQLMADIAEAPCPLAAARVETVVGELPPSAAEIAALLADVRRDWGHAPRTIWKIFRYLKNKTKDGDILLGRL